MAEEAKLPRLECLTLRFEGLEPFSDTLIFDLLSPYTVFVGPNGSGKTKILEAIAKVLCFLHDFDVTAPHSEVEAGVGIPIVAASRWKLATLEGRFEEKVLLPWATAAEESDRFEIQIAGMPEGLKLHYVSFEGVYWNFEDVGASERYFPRSRRSGLKSALNDLNARASQWETILSQSQNPTAYAAISGVIQTNTHEAKAAALQIRERLEGKETIGAGKPSVDVESVRRFIDSLQLPQCRIFQGSSIRGTAIVELEKSLRELRRAPYSDEPGSSYKRLLARLGASTKMKATLHGDRLAMDGRVVEELSFGTQLKLSFLALEEQSLGRPSLIIWDEPETGLHPSWCVIVADMMRSSGSRYFVGTHRTEFVVAESADNYRVYRLNGEFDLAEHLSVRTAVTRVDDHLGLLEVSQRLGLEPSRALFTANAIIWLEGPSDALFWRAWIRAAEAENTHETSPLREGFDFAFCFTGGSLLSHHAPLNDDVDADKIVQFLRVTPAALVIADSDVTDDAPETVRGAIEQSEKISASVVEKLKPRVQTIHAAIQHIDRPSRMSLILTYGREVEDSLTDEAFRATLASIAPRGLSDLASESTSTRTIWDGFTGSKDKFSMPDPPTEPNGRLVRNVEKVEFAQTYIIGSPKLSDLHPNARKRVEWVLQWIRRARAEYYQ